MRKRTGLAVVLCVLLAWQVSAPAGETDTCPAVGTWLDSETSGVLAPRRLFSELQERAVVLLGESHINPEHHRWQLQVAAALHAQSADLALGFEAFPRRVQPVLDRWVQGALDEQAFLDEVGWDQVWGYDAELYLPLFHFARQNRVPMLALNVDRELVARVGREGWESVPDDEREGLATPAPAEASYRQRLAEVYLAKQRQIHAQSSVSSEHGAETGGATIAGVLSDPGFQRFVEAQLTWDRAMAEALAGADAELVVAVIGQGHLAYGEGVASQLRDLGVENMATLLPMARREACETLTPGLADGVFVVSEWSPSDTPKPLLGVMIEPHDQGVHVAGVSADSVAEKAGIKKGDVIVRAASLELDRPAALVRIIQRQAPGTWLPLDVLRGDETLEFVARFPPE
jgi:uncharacterized iron-regulated protein